MLGYFSEEWVDEPILGFLSIFSIEEKPQLNLILVNLWLITFMISFSGSQQKECLYIPQF
jgi:hypothetical protein